MTDVRQWLAGLGLERYAEAFEREEVTLEDLPELTDAKLKDLNPALRRMRWLKLSQTSADPPLP